MADLRSMMEARADELREKIAKRKNQPGLQTNVEALEAALGEMERLLAQPEGDE